MGAMVVMDLPRQFFMIRFEKEEEYLAVLTGGPWRVFGSYLLTKAWSPDFDPLRDDIVTTPVWVRLSNLPVNFYHRSILMGIAKGLGEPIKVDLTTLNFERARFARICVEVNLKKPLKGTVMVNGERYYVSYEGLSAICSKCGLYGHVVHTCPHVSQTKVAAVIPSNENASPTAAQPSEDGFTVVRRSGRRTAVAAKPADLPGGSSDGSHERNLREIPINKDFENIRLSNRFGRLEDNGVSLEGRNVADSMAPNKENENIQDPLGEGKSVAQVTEKSTCVFSEKHQEAEQSIFSGKRAGFFKAAAHTGPKQFGPKMKVKQTRPARGLIFGPIREDVELSGSGKRLRSEKDNIGRPGGVFINEVEETDSTAMVVSTQTIGAVATRVEGDLGDNQEVRETTMLLGLPEGVVDGNIA